VLRKLEAIAFFSAMMLAVILEGSVVYWMFGHRPASTPPESSFNLVQEWSGAVLPQGWLLGALLALIYRLSVMLVPPRRWTANEFLRNRRAFVRLWRWVLALVTMQALVLFLGHASAS
jgi:hypothetical protein